MTTDKHVERRFDIHREEDIDIGVLQTIPFDYTGSATTWPMRPRSSPASAPGPGCRTSGAW